MAAVIASVENVFDSMGAMRGNVAYVKRAAIGAGLGYVAMETIRPSFAYYDDGTARPWAFSTMGSTADAATGQLHSTYVPWWSGPVVGAIVCTNFI